MIDVESSDFDERDVGDSIVHVNQWIHYNPSVGVNQMHIVGLPGTGKSNLACALANKCVLHENERIVMPGDRFCEWRHFINHPRWKERKYRWRILLPVHEEGQLYFHEIPASIKRGFVQAEHDDLDVMDLLDKDDMRLVVIYDQHLPRYRRVQLWNQIGTQLLNRTEYLDSAIILLFHEAGNYFPESARNKHWKAVNDFSEMFVEFRKGLVRTILVSQIKTEVDSTIRGKCLEKIFRQCWPGKTEPKPVRRAAPFLPINKYIHVRGGLYNLDCTINKFIELKKIWKIIPHGYSVIEGEGGKDSSKKKYAQKVECLHCGYIWKKRTENPKTCPSCKNRLNGAIAMVEE